MPDDDRIEPKTQEQAALIPPSRRPPTAIGAATPDPPHHVPDFRRPRARRRSVLRFLAGAAQEYVDLLAGAAVRGIRALDAQLRSARR
jgi:hypothetical protein